MKIYGKVSDIKFTETNGKKTFAWALIENLNDTGDKSLMVVSNTSDGSGLFGKDKTKLVIGERYTGTVSSQEQSGKTIYMFTETIKHYPDKKKAQGNRQDAYAFRASVGNALNVSMILFPELQEEALKAKVEEIFTLCNGLRDNLEKEFLALGRDKSDIGAKIGASCKHAGDLLKSRGENNLETFLIEAEKQFRFSVEVEDHMKAL